MIKKISTTPHSFYNATKIHKNRNRTFNLSPKMLVFREALTVPVKDLVRTVASVADVKELQAELEDGVHTVCR